jgi:putative acetyltransferase
LKYFSEEQRIMLTIRTENPDDVAAVYNIQSLAFGQPNEANLVDALRQHADPFISLVAELSGQIIGHIFFSPVSIEDENSSFMAMGLVPLAVLPEFQNQGIGSALVTAGLDECQRLGHDVVVVLGHPKYYPRFGFVSGHSKGIRSEYNVPADVFMVSELTSGALKGRKGLVKYHAAFSKL